MTAQSSNSKEQRRRGRKISSDSASSTRRKRRSDSKGRRLYLWCTQCFRKRKNRRIKPGKSIGNFFGRMRRKCKNRKGKRSFPERKGSTPARGSEERAEEISRTRRRKRGRDIRTKDSKTSTETRRLRQRGTSDALETLVDTGRIQADEDEKEIRDHVLERDTDFAKSCCYLCAKNTLALAEEISSRMNKAHVSIQASTQYFREDKSCNPQVHVRTVKSSVKVKVRDMGTIHPEKKKTKKPKFKLKLKKPDIIPRMRFPIQPKVRTVACETDKLARNHNVPQQCRAKHGTHCVTEKK